MLCLSITTWFLESPDSSRDVLTPLPVFPLASGLEASEEAVLPLDRELEAFEPTALTLALVFVLVAVGAPPEVELEATAPVPLGLSESVTVEEVVTLAASLGAVAFEPGTVELVLLETVVFLVVVFEFGVVELVATVVVLGAGGGAGGAGGAGAGVGAVLLAPVVVFGVEAATLVAAVAFGEAAVALAAAVELSTRFADLPSPELEVLVCAPASNSSL
jgi:hypothetical protein